ncbi:MULTISPECIES: Npun_R1517 family heterocyst differentiation transcriptional regulator [Chroococcaceae]|jgi:hypothetical protein|uniref:Npun R1517 domain-containing protein n=1 Tax=Chroogloeocystis siderophila 5.2 s.c.1 TaxID=247279 RepID=A0A1U7HWN6_9CHRO|nr:MULTISPECIES: Npun_R1517 family heterocyst differentiation transcriptional regulator [Chroococcaceae]AFZ31885.1 hypothetical protein Glo7428_3406 [Gloeocapsa sp. PCC 7428]OKH27945.1 hypothetical protein NIES1031_05005 [Chroogloeocystis siderophila 5.2 s.c.1]
MKSDAIPPQSNKAEVSVYECNIQLKFRLIEEKCALRNRDDLLELLIEAFANGADEYMEPLHAHVDAQEISELEASPQMRRQLMRLRNSLDLA